MRRVNIGLQGNGRICVLKGVVRTQSERELLHANKLNFLATAEFNMLFWRARQLLRATARFNT